MLPTDQVSTQCWRQLQIWFAIKLNIQFESGVRDFLKLQGPDVLAMIQNKEPGHWNDVLVQIYLTKTDYTMQDSMFL